MRKNLIFIILLLSFASRLLGRGEFALRLCVVPDLKEGILDLLWIKIDQLWHQGKYGKIFPLFYLLSRLEPENPQTWSTGAWFLMKGIAWELPQEEKERILQYGMDFLKEGIKYNPEDYQIYWEIAWIYYERNQYDTALEYLEKAERFPHPFFVESLKGHIYIKKGEKEKAKKVWRLIKEKFPEVKDLAEKFLRKIENDSGRNNKD